MCPVDFNKDIHVDKHDKKWIFYQNIKWYNGLWLANDSKQTSTQGKFC